MAFRDHLGAATEESNPTSLIHGMWEHSRASHHDLTMFHQYLQNLPVIGQPLISLRVIDYAKRLELLRRNTSTPLVGQWKTQVNQ